jgi:inosine-uridine nucleoside N-ribohydrolase
VAVPVLIDCDPGHDDAMALLLALASPELELLGVTTVHGNSTLENTTANALRVLEFAGHGHVPVAAGADRPPVREPRVAEHVHGATGLDGPDLPPPAGAPVAEHAVDFLADRLRAAGRPVTLIPTGPMTNVALLFARHPDAAEHLERIVLMGGAIAEGNVTPAAEFNIWADPEAAARVFAAGVDVTMVGLDVTHRALMTADHAERLRASGRVGAMVAEL